MIYGSIEPAIIIYADITLNTFDLGGSEAIEYDQKGGFGGKTNFDPKAVLLHQFGPSYLKTGKTWQYLRA